MGSVRLGPSPLVSLRLPVEVWSTPSPSQGTIRVSSLLSFTPLTLCLCFILLVSVPLSGRLCVSCLPLSLSVVPTVSVTRRLPLDMTPSLHVSLYPLFLNRVPLRPSVCVVHFLPPGLLPSRSLCFPSLPVSGSLFLLVLPCVSLSGCVSLVFSLSLLGPLTL